MTVSFSRGQETRALLQVQTAPRPLASPGFSILSYKMRVSEVTSKGHGRAGLVKSSPGV